MAAPKSCEKLLKKHLRKNPKRILEWGPGDSTILMASMCPNAEIITIEHIKKFYDEWRPKIPESVRMILIPDPENEDREKGYMPNYTNPPVDGIFDLIFVDGRCRVDCMRFAKDHMDKNSVLILHDSERPRYKKGIAMFNLLENDIGTVCLKLLS